MCVSFLGKFYEQLKESKVEFVVEEIENALKKSCKAARGKDNRLVSQLVVTR